MSDKKKVADKKKKPAANEKEKAAPKGKAALIAKIKKEQEKENELKLAEEKARLEEEERQRKIELKRIEEERMKQEKKEKKKLKEKERIERQKKEGTYLSLKEKKKLNDQRSKFGITVGGTMGDKENEEIKKPIYTKRRKQVQKRSDETVNNKEETNEVVDDNLDNLEQHVVEADDASELSSELIDWEDMVSESEEENDSAIEVKEVEKIEKLPEVSIRKIEKEVNNEDVDPMEVVQNRLKQYHMDCESKRDTDNLRSPIVCVLGHVDTGKTKILDKLRHTDVQGGETGGITQQIGATNVPIQNIPNVVKAVPNLRLPGLLIIDTPGHESFSNMRMRGSSLCDIAVLVVDLMHGVQEQTRESIRLLKKGKVPFVVALNKIDRLVDWKSNLDMNVKQLIDSQSVRTRGHFKEVLNRVIADFAKVEINVRCYWDEDEDEDYISMVPTSAHTGDGIVELLAYLCRHSQNRLAKRLAFSEELQASVMEVKETSGQGTTLDAILVNGYLSSNDILISAGQDGPIQTKIRYFLQPPPMAELRVKAEYQIVNKCKAAQGVKIVAKDLEKAMPGLPLYVARQDDEVDFYKKKLMGILEDTLSSIKVADVGVYVQTSSIGSLEALLAFLKQQQVPYAGINIGTVHKKDVVRASIMREKAPKWAVILAFNVKIEAEAEQLAKEKGVVIFRQEIIYRLFDDLTQYVEQLERENKEKFKDQVVFPVRLKVLPDSIFLKRNPILVGVNVESGILRLGTPLCVVTETGTVDIGKAMSIETQNKHAISEARTGQEVCVRIDPIPGEAPKMIDRHFKATDPLLSKISRESIDLLKQHYRNDLSNADWKLVMDLKLKFGIS